MSAGLQTSVRRCARGVAFAALAALLLFGATSRDGYRSALMSWRQLDTALERDAARAGAPLGPRADRVSAGAAKYYAERRAFLDRFAQENDQKLAWIETPVPPMPALSAGVSEYIAAETAAVRRGIDTFANDTDPGIQQVRTMLERENVALSALNAAYLTRQKAGDDADRAAALIEEARKKAADQNREFTRALKNANDEAGREAAAWTEYYRKLADAARGDTASPTSSIPASPDPPRAPSITPLPLIRYTGDWIYAPGGPYHGAQPEFVDFVVHEENGRADGRMTARFILPPGSSGDPILRFEFSGQFKNTRIQTFDVKTSDGATGTIDLIPGPAFNLLEINVQIAANPNKIRVANVVLVKK